MTDVFSKSKRSEIMSRVRNTQTNPENIVAGILKELEIPFERNVKDIYGTPDFAIRKYHTVIFVNGCFWHGHKNCARAKLPVSNKIFWKDKISGNIKRDRKTSRQLRINGS